MKRPAAMVLAWGTCGLTLALIACAVALSAANDYPFQKLYFLLTETSAVLVGGLIASRQFRNPVGWIIIGHALCFTLGEFGRQYAIYGVLTEPGSLPFAHAMASPAYWAWYPGLMLITSFLPLYFPDGRLVSPRWRPVAVLAFLSTALSTAIAVIRPGGYETRGVPNPLGIESLGDLGLFSRVFEVVLPVSWVLVGLLSVGSLVVRFLRSWGEERQQIKWVAFAAMFFISYAALVRLLPDVPLLTIVDEILFVASLQGLWIATGVAVLRYRLYDVDLVVNRALVYTVLTTLLVFIYFVGVAAFQLVLRPLPGDESQLAIVASTLAIAAVFNPLRLRMQELIDRRFYRSTYDARKTLEAFSRKLREETDLDRLAGDLVEVVEETMRPRHASLWLRPTDRPEQDGSGTTDV